jgi:formylmethanofuran dehydrogenase subunit E
VTGKHALCCVVYARRKNISGRKEVLIIMKRYYINVPRDYRFYTTVVAEDSREARFEAVKNLAFKLLHDFVPMDVSEGEKVYACDQCDGFFPEKDLIRVGEKLLCGLCEAQESGNFPEWW